MTEQNTDVMLREVRESMQPSGFEMRPRTLDEAMKFCEIMANSELVPKDYRDKPGNIMVAIQLGQELGLTPMRALRCIAVINGRASMWGDEMLALVLASPICEYVRETDSTETKGVCKVKRKGDDEEHVSTFTLEDAKRAGLLGKQGPWQTSTKRMLTLRARGFALRDKFPDVLAGLVTAEEALDIPLAPVVEAKVEAPQTLKDKLKAKVEEVSKGDATTQPGAAGKEENGQGDGGAPLSSAVPDESFHAATPPASSSDDPASPWRAKLRTCEQTGKELNRVYGSIPETIRQDCFQEYNERLRKVKGK